MLPWLRMGGASKMDEKALIEEVKKLSTDLACAEMTIDAISQICSRDTTAECHIKELIRVYRRKREGK